MIKPWPFLLLAPLLLAACSSNPNIVKPNPVPVADNSLKVERIWLRHPGKGVDKRAGYNLRPAVVDGRVFTADVRGRITAASIHKGKKQWSVATGFEISTSLYADDERLLFGTREGQAVAISADDGSLLWQQPLSSEVLSVPASDGRLAVFVAQDGQISAFDAASGEPRWGYSVMVPALILRGGSIPLIEDGLLYVGLASGKVIALSMSDGSLVWEQQVALVDGDSDLDRLVDIVNNLIVEQGGLFVSTYQGSVAVIDAARGQMFWEHGISTHVPMSYYLSKLYIATSSGDVKALHERSGEDAWTQDLLHGRQLTAALIQSGHVVVGDHMGWLYWLDPDNGNIVARYRVGRHFAGAPIVENDVLYVLSAKGRLSAIKVVPAK